jgi:hypothetical protein
MWLETGRWFSPVSSTNKSDRHNITAILFKVALNSITLTYRKTLWKWYCLFQWHQCGYSEVVNRRKTDNTISKVFFCTLGLCCLTPLWTILQLYCGGQIFFVDHCFSFCPFSFGNSIVCHSVIYDFRSPSGRRGRDRMVVGFTTIFAISAYHHSSCE